MLNHSVLLLKAFLGLTLIVALLPGAQSADVEIVEGEPDSVGLGTLQSDDPVRSTAPRTVYRNPVNNTSFPADTSTEMLLQLQSLQDEVRLLRGQVEEQAFKIERLERQRKEDYLEIDRRLSGGAVAATAPTEESQNPARQGDVSGASPPPVEAAVSDVAPVSDVAAASNSAILESSERQSESTDNVIRSETRVISTADDEGKEVYKSAYNMVKERNFDEAKVAMVAFIGDYPSNKYVPNAHFWLGELYYHDSDLSNSKSHFAVLVDTYPDHRKVPDAKFKLAKVMHQLGDTRQAKRLLRSVVKDHSNSRAAKPAREYLENSLD